MEAFYFGDQEKLFGIYHEANQALDKETGIVICNPIGQEYIRCYKAIQKLAMALADSGYHVLRFDYLGTGDSYGDDTKTNITEFLSNIKTAITEIKDCTGIEKIILVGLRLGASLSALIASRISIEKVVFWNPILDGKSYLEELLKSHKKWLKGSFAKRKKNQDNVFESNGFTINNRLYNDIRLFEMTNIDLTNTNKLLLISSNINLEILNKLKVKKSMEIIENMDGEFWIKKENEFDKSLVPVQEINALIKWLN